MSGTLLPTMVRGIDPWAAQKEFYDAEASQFAPGQAQAQIGLTKAQTGKTGAETGLIGQQTIGAGITNQLSALGLQVQGPLYQQLIQQLNDPNRGRANLPWSDQGGEPSTQTPPAAPAADGSAPGGGTAPGPAIGMHAAASEPVASPDAAPIPQQSLPAPPAIGNSTPLPRPGMAPPAPSQGSAVGGGGATGAAPQGGGGPGYIPGAPATTTGSGGIYLPGIGFPMPMQWFQGYMQSQNKPEALNQLRQARNGMLAQAVHGTIDPATGKVNPAMWNDGVRQLYEGGLLTNADAWKFYGHPERAGIAENMLLSPTETAGYHGAVSGAEKQAGVGPALQTKAGETAIEAQNTPETHRIETSPGVWQDVTKTRYEWVHGGTQAAPVYTPYRIQQALIGTEHSGADAVSPKGAAGTAQIEPGTFKQYAMPGESFGDENDRVRVAGRAIDDLTRKFGGDPARVAVGYFSGPGNVAPPGSPTPWKENRSDGNMTVSQYVDRFQQKLGVPARAAPAAAAPAGATAATPPPPAAAPAPVGDAAGAPPPAGAAANAAAQAGVPGAATVAAATEASPGAPASAVASAPPSPSLAAPIPAPAPGAAPPPGALAVGPQQLTPLQQAAVDVQKAVQTKAGEAPIKEQEDIAGAYGEQAAGIVKAYSAVPENLRRLDELQNAATEFRTGATGAIRGAALTRMVDIIQAAGGTPPEWMMKGATGSEVISKEGGYLAAQMTRMLGSREAAVVFNQIRDIQPNLKLSTGGFDAVLGSVRQGVIRDQDIGQYQEKWLKTHSSTSGMLTEFNQMHPPEAYASRVVPFPMPKSNDALKPNVIYTTAPGSVARKQGVNSLIWDGHQFHAVN